MILILLLIFSQEKTSSDAANYFIVLLYFAHISVLHWKILLKGPDDCPYAGGVVISQHLKCIQCYSCGIFVFSAGIFLLLAKFPQVYPSKPPEVRFVTPVSWCLFV